MAVRGSAAGMQHKPDGSPVTQADVDADRIIRARLASLLPDVPVVTEEASETHAFSGAGRFILVDPLDGTKEFVAGRAEFTVNLALVTNGAPLLGIVGAPALGFVWRGLVGRGAERLGAKGSVAEPIHTRTLPKRGDPWLAAVSRSHRDPRTEAFIEARPGAIRHVLGSAVKFARVAEGTADIYPRLAPTCEWDVAAGHALVTAAGGKVTDAQGQDVQFAGGREGHVVPEFIAWGDPAAALRR